MPEALAPIVERIPAQRRSLRLAIVTETYPPEINGVAATVASLVRGLHALHHEIDLVRPRQGARDRAEEDERFRELLRAGLPIPCYASLRMGLPSKRALLRYWALRRPDVVHVVTEGPLGWSALQAAQAMRIPVSTDFRTNFHAYSRHYGIGWLRKPILGYLRKFHNRADRTLVPTAALHRELVELGFRNVEVVERGVDSVLFAPARRSESLRAQWGASPRTPVVLHVGRLAAEKNLDTLAAAFTEIRAHCPGARFVVVGDGAERARLQARCPDAIFAGERIGDDLAAHYASADVFLFPSLTETFGNVTLEAMASGLALVAYDYAAAATHLHHEVSAFLAPLGDRETFVRMAAGLVADPRRCARLGARARAAAERLSWASVVARFEAILLALAERDPARFNRRSAACGGSEPDPAE